MDAYFLRRLLVELTPILEGARIEKIFHPADAVDSLVLYKSRTQYTLILRSCRSYPLLFTSSFRPPNPLQPSAAVMLLRKHIKNRHIVRVVSDWLQRRFALEISGGSLWLLVDLHSGLSLVKELPVKFGKDPSWPPSNAWPTLLQRVYDKECVREITLFTPALRRTLMHLSEREAHALMLDLESPAGGDIFLYRDTNGIPAKVSAWPVPPPERRGVEEVCPSALEGARIVGEAQLFGDMAADRRKEEDTPRSKALKRVNRALIRLEGEEKRLHALRAVQKDALALQAELYRFGTAVRLAAIEVCAPQAPDGVRSIVLDPLLTVGENMERMFSRVSKARRGLPIIAQRRAELEAERAHLKKGGEPRAASQSVSSRGRSPAAHSPVCKGRSCPGRDRTRGGLARFCSSDGFAILRGRNAKGNDAVLKTASAFDLWFHAQDAPGAHVVLRLDYPNQPVPERTMREAAMLAAARSGRRNDSSIAIMCARAGNVRKVKGVAAGAVRVDVVERTLVVAPDPSLEDLLQV